MRWRGRRESENVEDRRSARGPVVAGGGILGIIVVLAVIFMGGDPRPLLDQMQGDTVVGRKEAARVDPVEDERAKFVAVVLADTEDVCAPIIW